MKLLTMKQILIIPIIALSLLQLPSNSSAKSPDINGGVMDEYTYEEIIFITGEPIKFTGKATVTERESKNILTSTYKFILESPSKDKLTRTVVYTSDNLNNSDKGQTTSNTTVKSYSEKITMGKETYTLDNYQFSQGTVTDNRPASDFYSGNIIARKIYKTKNNDLITVHINGRNFGYKNFWGATETQMTDYEIEQNNKIIALVTNTVSDSKSRVLEYQPNTPTLSSFQGGHSVISSSDMTSQYTYDFPYGIGKGTIHLNSEMMPTIERLIVPKFRDLSTNWAKNDIERLYSLGIFDESSQFFSPNTPMIRYQFTIGLLKAVDLRVFEEPKAKKTTSKKAIFNDLNVKEKDYLYIESAVKHGIIKGVTPTRFEPDEPITRSQAVTILVRALGMEGRAPDPAYKTNYKDDSKIAVYAKDSVYVATELGLISGDPNGRFNPNQPLTRAQASAIISRFLKFLENDLKENYRDDVLLFS